MSGKSKDVVQEAKVQPERQIQHPTARILQPLAGLFRMGVTLRDCAYQRGWLKTQRLDRPVVSVGNLSVGGTGKTPLVMLIAKLLSQRGWNPGILTRGYGRRHGAQTVVLAPAAGR